MEKRSAERAKEEYESVIGLEVHVELSTRTKIFCGCSTAFGGAPNTRTCPVCTGMPGALPVLNRRVLEYALAVGLAMDCEITRCCRFDRKNYFYPDNPQNYQISQLYLPICRNGGIFVETPQGSRLVRIHELHMEEDAGKLLHEEASDTTLVDYNRSGVPLIEIVTEPDMRNAEEVLAFLEKLRLLLRYLGVSDCKLQEGSMRVDVNLSVRRRGEKRYGTRTEMKNLNSFRAVSRAIAGERKRQLALLEAGKRIVQETRRWDDAAGESFPMRSKEDAQDYRYFPEPDLMPLCISEELIRRIRDRQPELPDAKRERYRTEFAIPDYDIGILTGEKRLADIFEAAVGLGAQPKKVSNWLMGETLRLVKEKELEPEAVSFSPEHLVSLIDLTEQKRISSTVAKEIFELMFENDIDPEAYVRENGLETVQDETALRRTVDRVLAENPQSVEAYRGGKERALGFLVGQTMRAMRGQADPAAVNRLLREELSLLGEEPGRFRERS